MELLYKQEVYEIIGAAMEVHRVLGSGFLEGVYQEAMEIELAERGIPFRAQVELPVFYKGRRLKKHYCADFVCYDGLIVDLKALTCMSGAEESQILNYLKATQMRLGLLVNFGHPSALDWKRFVRFVS